MPWFSLAEAENYNTASAAWALLVSDPNNAPIYNSVQFGGPNNCGGGIDRYCISNDTPTDYFDSIAMRNMSLQCYNRSILWARNKDPADLAKTIEILEYWMVGPTTRMEPYLTTTTGAIGQYVFVPCYLAAYNLVKDQTGWTNKAAVEQWIVDFTAFLYPRRLNETFSNKVDFLTACMLAGAIVTNDSALYTLARNYFITLLNSRFLADGRVIDDYQRTTGLSYTMFALEAMSLSAEMIYRQSNGVDNLFQHNGYQLALAYAAPYALNPGTWPWQQTTPYTLDQNRVYEFANTRDPQPIYAQIIANSTPFYVDTCAGHVTLTNSAASVLSAPAILTVSSVTQSNGSGGVETIVSWSTDVPTTGTVTWGDSVAESSPEVLSPILSTNHSITLSPITEGVQYFYTVEALTALSVPVSSSQRNFIAEIDNPPIPGTYADEFNTATLGPQWTFTDPVGDSTLTKLSSGVLISVPGGGADHDAWEGGNNSARIMHPLPDDDFYTEFKVDSAVTQRYQSQGFIAELDNTNFIRFDFYSDGTVVNIHAGTVINDVGTTVLETAITANTTLYMRVRRTGDVWEQSYSYNGANWVIVGSFTQAISINSAGLFAGNVGTTPVPAHTASFDYYRVNQLSLTPISNSFNAQWNISTDTGGGGTGMSNVIRLPYRTLTTTGTQSIRPPAFLSGIVSKGAEIWVTQASTADTITSHACLSVGMLDGGGNQASNSIAIQSAANPTQANRSIDGINVISLLSPNGGGKQLVGQAALVAGGMDIVWSVANPGMQLIIVFYYGTDLSCHVATEPIIPNTTGSSSLVTGLGFKPNYWRMSYFDTDITTGTSAWALASMGSAYDDGNAITQMCHHIQFRDNVPITTMYSTVRTSSIGYSIGGAESITVHSPVNDGYQIRVDETTLGAGGSNENFICMAMDVAALEVEIGTDTTQIGSSQKTTSMLSTLEPDSVIFMSTMNSFLDGNQTAGDTEEAFSTGIATLTESSSFALSAEGGSISAASALSHSQVSGSALLLINGGDGSDRSRASMSGTVPGAFTLDYAVGAGAYQFIYDAWGMPSSSTSTSLISSVMTAQWYIQSEVSSTAQGQWNVLNNVTSLSTLLWNSSQTVSNVHTVLWNVNSTLSVVGNAITLGWNVAAEVIAISGIQWNTYENVKTALNAQWDVLSSIQSNSNVRWNASMSVISKVTAQWDVLSATGNTFSSVWDSAGKVSNNIFAKWDVQILGSTQPAQTITMPVRGRVIKLF